MKTELKTDKLGVALIVSGPSGAGKSTVCHAALEKIPNLSFSISCTTRPPRPVEENGKHYYFIAKEDFDKKIAADEFIEYAEVHGNLYGTLRSEVLEKISKGMDVILDIDVQGAQQIKKRAETDQVLAECTEFVFIGPPSYEDLKNRLSSRGTEKEEIIKQRLDNARFELEQWREYDYLIINAEIDKSVNTFISLYTGLKNSTKRIKDFDFYGQ